MEVNTKRTKNPWEPLGFITIDTGRLILVDPMYVGFDDDMEAEAQEVPIPDDPRNLSGVVVSTGLGDGRYRVEGRYIDTPFGRRLAEIRVRFLDSVGMCTYSEKS